MARARLWLKVTASLALLAALAAGAAVLALKAFFPEPKARAFVLEKARKQLGREVRLARIDAGLTGLHLQGLEVSERPDFAAGTFLSVETFSLRPSWKALLRRKLVIASASADGLVVSVVRNADGSFNFDTLAGSAAASTAAPAKPSEEAPAEFNVRHLRVARGAAAYVDKAAGASWSASGLTLRLDDFSLAEPFDLEASARVKGKAGGRPVDAALGFEGTVHPARGDRDKFKVDVRRLSAEQEGLALVAKGKVAGLEAPAAELEAALTAAGKTLLDAKGDISVSSPAAGGARVIDVDLKLKTSGLDTTLIAKWLPAAGIPALTIPAGDAVLEGRYEGSTAALKSFRVSWAEGKIEGSGAARGLGGSAPVYEGRAKFGVDVPEIRAGRYPWIKLPPKTFIPAMRLDGEGAYAGGEVRLASLEAKFKQGTASASGVVRGLGGAKLIPDLALRFAVDVPSFKVSELPVAVAALPPGFIVPAMRLDGGARVKGDDLVFEKAAIKGKSGTLRLDGVVAKALAGAPDPALDITADLDLPALTDKDLPFPGVPPGLELPASRWDADLSYTPRAIRLRRFAVKIASNEISIEGGVSDPAGRGAFDLLVKCKRFVLEELTRLTPRTRDLKLAGSGFFALSVTGTKEKPLFGGKLQFKGLGATVAEMALSEFTGTASFDERRIDVPNLTGKIADGTLTMDLTVKEYAKVPEIQVEASLDRFDLGRYLTAKKKLETDAKASRAGKAERAGKPTEAKPATPIRTRGKVDIGALIHPNAQVQAVAASWDLYGVTPDMKKLSGDAKIGTGAGKLHAVGDMALQSPIVKVLIFPILIFQKLSLGVNLNDITVRRITGDYLFKDGVMTLRQSEMDSTAAQISALGTIDLPAEALDLTVTAQVGNLPALDVAVTGTVTTPKTKVKVGKLLENAGKNLIEGLLRR
ncbi:MAG: AsmA-like C-terminal region-containing protein [Elusimicrobiota bacterium]|nr:AsmA-like C-terminal region-containing protein [Elusimicrobiota bacterium]